MSRKSQAGAERMKATDNKNMNERVKKRAALSDKKFANAKFGSDK